MSEEQAREIEILNRHNKVLIELDEHHSETIRRHERSIDVLQNIINSQTEVLNKQDDKIDGLRRGIGFALEYTTLHEEDPIYIRLVKLSTGEDE